jgi:hypothetical protein
MKITVIGFLAILAAIVAAILLLSWIGGKPKQGPEQQAA